MNFSQTTENSTSSVTMATLLNYHPKIKTPPSALLYAMAWQIILATRTSFMGS
jgi:hypothetical protein